MSDGLNDTKPSTAALFEENARLERELKSARDSALEEAARVCDDMANRLEEQIALSANARSQQKLEAKYHAAQQIAAAIRALKATHWRMRMAAEWNLVTDDQPPIGRVVTAARYSQRGLVYQMPLVRRQITSRRIGWFVADWFGEGELQVTDEPTQWK